MYLVCIHLLSSLTVKYVVYETSLYLSVLFRASTQTTSIVNQLIPHGRGIYDAHIELSTSYETKPSLESPPEGLAKLSLGDSTSSRQERQPYRPPHLRCERTSHPSIASKTTYRPSERPKLVLRPNIMSTALITFFHIMVHSYPSQSSYHSTLAYFLQQSQFSHEDDGMKEILKWLKSIASAVASRNYVRFERLSRSNEVDDVCRRLGPLTSRGIDSRVEMSRLSLRCLVEDLRTKVRDTVWDIVTVTYRELDTIGNADWLLQSLMIAPDPKAGDSRSLSDVCQFADSWLEQRGETEVRRKEGYQGRWILCRRRT